MYIKYLHQRSKTARKRNPFTIRRKDRHHASSVQSNLSEKRTAKQGLPPCFWRKDPAHPKPRYNQVLVIWKFLSRTMTAGRFPGSRLSILPPSRFLSDRFFAWQHHSAYSDGIAQAFHLLPFYPLPARTGLQRHRLLHIQFCLLYRRKGSVVNETMEKSPASDKKSRTEKDFRCGSDTLLCFS